jgi:hypothetical protein
MLDNARKAARDDGVPAGPPLTAISYGLKFRNATAFADGQVIDWPLAWSARVRSWLHEKQNGLQPLSG